MDMPAGHCFSTQLIDENGNLSVDGLESFVKSVQLCRCGVSYAVVSIMGPQSAGKSTLLNHLFGTNFMEMDASRGRCQTTRGLWLAKANGLEPLTIVMDLEGTDGIERAEDDIMAFEKQITLFALAVSDVMLINMWCHDIGRDAAANRPLLKTVFTVMMRMTTFTPVKKTLMFLIRDKTRTPLDLLQEALCKDVQKIWDSIPKPQMHQQTPLSELFNVEVVALSSYEHNEDQFKDQVSNLRKRFFHSTSPGGVAGDRSNATPGSAFSCSASQIWSVIKENKDLQLATHQVMVATYCCEEIASTKYSAFTKNKEWQQIEDALQSHEPQSVPDFGRKLQFLNARIDDCMKGYDSETIHFDGGVRSAKGKELEEKLLQLMEPAFKLYLTIVRAQTIEEFRNKFDEAVSGGDSLFLTANDCTRQYLDHFRRESADALIERAKAKWDASEQIKALESDMDAHIAGAGQDGLLELTREYKANLFEELTPTRALLDQANCETWLGIRNLLRDKKELVFSSLSSKLTGLGVDKQKQADVITELEAYARNLVEKEAKEKADNVVEDMTNRFLKLFGHDSNLNPRLWTGKENFKAIITKAFASSLELLSIRAIVYLEANDIKGQIYSTLKSVLLNTKNTKLIAITKDPWASKNWAEVLLDTKGSNRSIASVSSSGSTEREEASMAVSSNTMIKPSDCINRWNKFLSEIEYNFTEGKKTWKAAARKKLISNTARCAGSAVMQVTSSALGNLIGMECYRSLHPESDDEEEKV